MTLRASVPLRSYWFSRRKPSLDIVDDTLEIVLPGYFGRRRWRVPIAACAATDLTALSAAPQQTEHDGVFAEGIDLPYFFTTGPVWAPNLLLQFRQPQRVPALGWIPALAPNVDLPFSWRQSRSVDGGRLDGLLVRSVDPAEAVRALADAGVELTIEPERWMEAHRELVEDPVAKQKIIGRSTRAGAIVRTSNWVAGGAVAVGVVWRADETHWPSWSPAVPLAGLAAAALLRWRARRLMSD